MNYGVAEIFQKDDRTLSVHWTDKRQSDLDVVNLRRRCPCAACVDERTGQRLLKPEDVADSVRPTQIHSVGNYAMSIHFSDGHKTGIYAFDYLRSLAA